MDQKVIELIETSFEALKKAIEVAQEQLPILAEEIIRFNILQGAIAMTILAVVMTSCYFLFKKIKKNHDEYKLENGSSFDDSYIVGYLLVGIVFVLCFIFFSFNLVDVAKACVAPRLFLLEELRNFVI